MMWLNQNVLSIMLLVPFLCSLLCAFIRSWRTGRWVALCGSAVSFFLSLYVWYCFDPTETELQFVQAFDWAPRAGIRYLVGVDALNLLLLVFSRLLTPLILASYWKHGERQEHRFSLAVILLLLDACSLGVLIAFDLLCFCFFWELMSLPFYFMAVFSQDGRSFRMSGKFSLFSLAGSFLMLIAVINLYQLHYQEYGFWSFRLSDLYKMRSLPFYTQAWIFAAFIAGFLIKMPLWPVCSWLLRVQKEVSPAVAVVMMGLLLKMGTYGFLRFALPIFPDVVESCTTVMMILGVAGILYGSLVAWRQSDVRKVVICISMSHLSVVVVGATAVLPRQLSVEALTGAVYQMMNYGVSTVALLLLSGMLAERQLIHKDQSGAGGGLSGIMPVFSVMLSIACLGAVGLPGTGGFVGQFFILLGTFRFSPVAAMVALAGVVLGAFCLLMLCKNILFSPPSEEDSGQLRDLNWLECFCIVPLVSLILLAGIFPALFLDKVRPGLEHLAKNYRQHYLSSDETSAHIHGYNRSVGGEGGGLGS